MQNRALGPLAAENISVGTGLRRFLNRERFFALKVR